MTEQTRRQLLDKNKKIIDMVIEKAKKEYPDDIALIGLTGSFSTGDFHEKSDLDLIIVNDTPRGWEIAMAFILDDVGYDIYCTPWKPRIEAQAKLESPHVSCLINLQILYVSKPEFLVKYNEYKQQALALLAEPIGDGCLSRGKKHLDAAKQSYADAMLSDDLGTVRYASCGVVYNLINALTSMNNTYIKQGIKRYLETMLAYQYIPRDLETSYMAVINAVTINEIRETSKTLLKSVCDLYDDMYNRFVKKPQPTYDNLIGTYEELWCNCRNKVIDSVKSGNISYAFHAAMGAQNYLDEMHMLFGTPKFDLMRHFDAKHLTVFQDAFLQSMDEYLKIYQSVGRRVEKYDNFDTLYQNFMNNPKQ